MHVYCTLSISAEEVENFSPLFTLQKQRDSGRVYAEKYRVYDHNKQWLYDFYRVPKTPVINPLSAQIRLSNQECYTSENVDRLKMFMECFNCVYRNISRIDLCLDFLNFENRLNPFKVIKDFMAAKYMLRRNIKFAVYGMHKFDLEFECLKLGSPSSAVSVKLYNKTQEMQSVKIKPYILETWINNDLCYKLDSFKPVWRLEFSLTADAQELLDYNTGEMFKMNLEWVDVHANLTKLFLSLQKQYFDVVINNGQLNKTRMQSVKLLPETLDMPLLPKRVNTLKCSNKMDKYIIKRLANEMDAKRVDRDIYTEEDKVHILAFLYRFALAHKINRVAELIEKGSEVEMILQLLNNY